MINLLQFGWEKEEVSIKSELKVKNHIWLQHKKYCLRAGSQWLLSFHILWKLQFNHIIPVDKWNPRQLNTLRPKQNGLSFVNGMFYILIKISPKVQLTNQSTFIYIFTPNSQEAITRITDDEVH